MKGFGYADFEDRESLVKALDMDENMLQNRKIKIDLATNNQRDGGRGGFGDRRGGDREYICVFKSQKIFFWPL